MSLAQLYEKKGVYLWLSLVIVVLLPFGSRLMGIPAGLMFLAWLSEGRFRQKFSNLLSSKMALALIGFYLLHIIGMLYTSTANLDAGWFDLQVKLSLLIFPLIFLSGKRLTGRAFQYIIIGFVSACCLALLVCFFNSFYHYFTEGNLLYYTRFSIFLHPAYFSMYLSFSAAVAFLQVLNKWSNRTITIKVSLVILILYLTAGIIFLSARMGIICYIFIFGWFIYQLIFVRDRRITGLIILVVLTAASFFITMKTNIVQQRFSAVLKELSGNPNRADLSSVSQRIIIWASAYEILKDKWLTGVGTGDVKTALTDKYWEKGMVYAAEKQFNAHNQFFQVFLALGIVGIVLFVFSLLWPFMISVQKDQPLLSLFLFIIFTNALTESILETQAGTIFYGFFISFLSRFENQTALR